MGESYYLRQLIFPLTIRFIGVILIGIFITIIITPDSNLHKTATQVIKDCEQSLPRNQHCKLTAIVENNNVQ